MLYKSEVISSGVLSDFNSQMTEQHFRHGDWRISKSKSGEYLILEKAFYRVNIFGDRIHFIQRFLDKLYNREYNSILCGGLGLGVAPYMSQTFCHTVDVVEIDQDLIHLIKSAGYLNSKVNIIHADFFTYQPEKKYDLILADIWQDELGDFNKEVDNITEKYSSYLNDGGLLYFPLVHLLSNNEAPCGC